MRKLFLIVVILCSVGVLGAQETSSVADRAALLAHLETVAGFVAGGVAANGLGYGLFAVGSIIPPRIAALQVSGVVLIPLGYIATTIAYSNLLETYNSAFPSDGQIMLPYLLLTLAGAASAANLWLSTADVFGGRTTDQEIVAGILFVPGLISYITGLVVSIVHTQELLAKAKASGTAPAVSELSTQQDRITIMPDIGANYLGIAISMP